MKTYKFLISILMFFAFFSVCNAEIPNSYLDKDPAGVGLTIKTIQAKIETINSKGESITESDKQEKVNYLAILDSDEAIIHYEQRTELIKNFVSEKSSEFIKKINKQTNEVKKSKKVDSVKDLPSLLKVQGEYIALRDETNNTIAQLQKYIDGTNSLTKNSQDVADVGTDKIIANRNLLAGTSGQHLSNSERLKVSADNAAIQAQIESNQYAIANVSLMLEKLNTRLQAYQDLLAAVEIQLSSVNDKIQEIRKNEALSQESVVNAEQQMTDNKHPFIEILANENQNFINFLADCFDKTNNNNKTNAYLTTLIDRTKKIESDINSQIKYFNDTIFLSQILFNQQHIIPNYILVGNTSDDISDLRVSQYKYSSELEQMSNREQYIKDLWRKKQMEGDFPLEILDDVNKLLDVRAKVLVKLSSELTVELNSSVNVQINYQKYVKFKENLNNQIYEQMFWCPSNKAINAKWFKSFKETLAEQKVFLSDSFGQLRFASPKIYRILNGAPILILLIAIFLLRNKINNKLKQLNNYVGRFSKDNHLITIKSIGLCLLKCLLWPLIVLFFGIELINYIDFGSTSDVIESFDKSAMLIVFHLSWLIWISFFYLEIYRPNGVAEKHFGIVYNNKHVNSLRRIFIYLAVILVLVLWKEYQPETFAKDVIGQLSMIGLVLGITFEFLIQLKNKFSDGNSWWSRFVVMLIIGILLFVVVLTACGYYYSAIRISDRLIVTYYIILAYNIIYQTITRSLSLAARRLKFKRAREAREAKKLDDNTNNNNDSEVVDSVDEEMPISEISNQSQSIVKYMMISIFALVLYQIWSEILSVTSYFEYISLYDIKADDQSVIRTISLMDILVVSYSILITTIVTKNFPGVLEVIFFNRFANLQRFSYSIVSVVTYVLIAICTIFCCAKLGLSWEKLQWLVAALSVGLGFGLQEIFANFISGLIILFERPVRIGDIITINNHSGVVSKIRIRATTITDFDRKDYVVPNREFITSSLTNWSLNDSITRLIVQIGVGYGSSVDVVRDALKRVADRNSYVLKDPECKIYFTSFGDSNLNFELRVYVRKTIDRNPCLDSINTDIYNEFNRLGIEIAFNQMDVYVKNIHSGQEIKVDHRFDGLRDDKTIKQNLDSAKLVTEVPK